MLRIDLIDDARAELGEGPLWDVAEQRLYWIDSLGAQVHSLRRRRRRTSNVERARTYRLSARCGRRAAPIVSLRDGFYTLDFATARGKLVDPDPGKPRIRMNDGKVDRQGRFVAGYMDYEESDPLCGVFRLDPDGSVTQLDGGIVCSNGPCWSPDGRTFYFADTATPDIWAYDYDVETGTVSNRRTFARFRPPASRACRTAPPSTPRASSGASRSTRGSSCASPLTARLDRLVGLPVESTTSLSFGGPNLDIAYVTSMARP